MRLTRKYLILICVALVVAIAAITVVSAIGGDKNSAAAETVTYVYNAVVDGVDINATATHTGDNYTFHWREHENVVRGSYDETAGAMENWGNELPLCDAGLAGVQTEDGEQYTWKLWPRMQDTYYYNHEGLEYVCRFNRTDKTYERWTDEKEMELGWFFHEAGAERFMVQISNLTDKNPKGAVYRFAGNSCNATEAALLRYEKQESEGKSLYIMKQYTDAMYGERVYTYEFEGCGDELNLTRYEIAMNYEGGYADYYGESEITESDYEIHMKKVADGCYIDESIPAICLFVEDEEVVLADGRTRNGDGAVLNYEAGNRLEMEYQGQMVGCHVEGDDLVVSIGDGKEYRLTRVDK